MASTARWFRRSTAGPSDAADCQQLEDAENVAGLLTGLQSSDGTIREAAARALCKVADDSALEPLVEALEDDLLMVRRWAAEALGWLGSPRALEPLAEAAGRRDPRDRFGTMERVATEAAARIAAKQRAVDPIERMLARLWTAGTPSVIHRSELLARYSGEISAHAVSKCIALITELRASGEPAACDGLMHATLRANHHEVRAAAARAILELQRPNAIELLRRVLHHSERIGVSTTVNALRALKLAGDESTAEEIAEFLTRFRHAAKANRPFVTDFVSLGAELGEAEGVCRAALDALAAIGGAVAVRAIESVGEDEMFGPLIGEESLRDYESQASER